MDNPFGPGTAVHDIAQILLEAKQPMTTMEIAKELGYSKSSTSANVAHLVKAWAKDGVTVYQYLDRGPTGAPRRLLTLHEQPNLTPWTGPTLTKRVSVKKNGHKEPTRDRRGHITMVSGLPPQPLCGSMARVVSLVYNEDTDEVETVIRAGDTTYVGNPRGKQPEIGVAGVIVAVGLHGSSLFMDIACDNRQVTIQDLAVR